MTFVDQKEKGFLLTLYIKREEVERALVFSRTKHGADKIVRQLAASGIVANAIHGNKSQPQRERALADFKSGRVKVLIATDIAARGIDVSGVSHVINYDLPNVFEQYVHRIGRTARAGAEGIAFSMCADDERPYIRGIEKLTRQRIEVRPLPSDFGAEAARMRALRPAPEPARGERPPQRHNRGPRHDQAPRRDGQQPRRDAQPHGHRNDARPHGTARPAHAGAARPAHAGAGRPHGGARPQGAGRPAGGGGPRGPQRDNRGGRPGQNRTGY
jgi:ATP-dependent RNA helicase RhlE